jgi:hypothetical protein
MKKITLIAFIFLAAAASFAQGIDLGIKAGANFATLTDVPNISPRTGLVIGAFATLKFTDKMALQGDLLYSQQGADNSGLKDLQLDYIIFPIVFKYYIVKRLNIQAGPQFGNVITDNYNANFQSFDVSGVVGIGLDLPFNLRVTGRYNFGLNNIGFVDLFSNSGITTDAKNSVFSITAGFSFL